MPQRWVIGLSCGATADGMDAVLAELRGVGLDVTVGRLHGLHQPFPAELRELARHAAGPTCDVRQVSRLHRLLGETFAAGARAVADGARVVLQQVQAIGCQGHTVGHDPDGRFPTALPLGMAGVIAERCGVTVVSDFRSRDLAAGGQGAPLAALPDYLLFRDPGQTRLLLHLGGVARLVYLPAGGRLREVVGFEAGPCSLLLDALIRRLTGGREPYDPGGKHAVQGRCVESLLQSWLAHPALQRRPPRSLPREPFTDEFADRAVHEVRQHGGTLHDLLCTATHFVARNIAQAARRFLPAAPAVDRVLLSGGGVRNGFLWQLLAQGLEPTPLQRTDALGVPASLRKPLAIALLAALTLDGVPGNAPSATGAAGSRLLGSLTPGSQANWARCLHWMAQHAAAPAGV